MSVFLLSFLILLFAGTASADNGIISFNRLYLDSAGKFSFAYPTSLPNQKALQELQKNFFRQKFGEKSVQGDPVAVLRFYKSEHEGLEYLSDALSFPLPGILQYVTSYYVRPGDAAHGIRGFDIGIYTISNGKKVDFRTFFNKNWEKDITKLIIKEFLLTQNLLSLADYNFTQKESDFIPTNVKINSGGLEFVYPIYKIATYDAGEQSIFLSWSALKPYLNQKSVIYPKIEF